MTRLVQELPGRPIRKEQVVPLGKEPTYFQGQRASASADGSGAASGPRAGQYLGVAGGSHQQHQDSKILERGEGAEGAVQEAICGDQVGLD